MFNKRKKRTFNYKPRFQDSDANNSNDKASKTDFEEKWYAIRSSSKRRKSIFTSLPVLLIMLIAIFVLIYILEGYM